MWGRITQRQKLAAFIARRRLTQLGEVRAARYKMQDATLTTAQNAMWLIHCLTDWISRC